MNYDSSLRSYRQDAKTAKQPPRFLLFHESRELMKGRDAMEGVGRVLGYGREGRIDRRMNGDNVGEVDERPKSVYELITRRMLEELREDISEVKGRVNALLWVMVGAILMELVMRVFQ